MHGLAFEPKLSKRTQKSDIKRAKALAALLD
jgi:hypothetical protein